MIELHPNRGITSSQRHLGYSEKNDFTQAVNIPDAISIYKFEWKFDLTIINNSEINAFNTVLLQHTNLQNLVFNKNINSNRALKAHEDETLPFVFSKIVETAHKVREKHFTKRPAEFKNLMLLLEYENQYGRKFYSRYYFNTDKTELTKINASERKYWC